MKIAYLLVGELRLVKDKINKLYDFLFDYYDVDIYLLMQRSCNEDYENLKLLKRRVVYSEFYDKPEPDKYLDDDKLDSYPKQNWSSNNCTQYYINLEKMVNIISSVKEEYDFYITGRIDIDILFPYPPIDLIEKLPPAIYEFNPDYCRSWGGYATGFLVHKKFIIDYLSSTCELIRNKDKSNLIKFIDKYCVLNQENFTTYSWEIKNIPRKFINTINSYFTCDSLSSRTTWNKPVIHDKYNVICKYPLQCEEVFQNFEKWKNGKRWIFKNDVIYLE